MARFGSPDRQGEKQAHAMIKELQRAGVLRSVRTGENYESALKTVATTLAENRESLRNLTPERAVQYLQARAEEVGQSQLNMERQAIQAMMTHITGQLEKGQTLTVVKSELKQIASSRAYTREQVQTVMAHQNERNSLATEIAYQAGLRAHELYTLERTHLRPADERTFPPNDIRELAKNYKFDGREGISYTVVGKGGLVREIRLPNDLASRLEAARLTTPREIVDRGVFYRSNYDIPGGKNFSSSFSQASKRGLGWSEGAHGLRHSYAQERMSELQQNHRYTESLAVVSQELGHFRPDITEIYLR